MLDSQFMFSLLLSDLEFGDNVDYGDDNDDNVEMMMMITMMMMMMMIMMIIIDLLLHPTLHLYHPIQNRC
jgi:hypothetical protein